MMLLIDVPMDSCRFIIINLYQFALVVCRIDVRFVHQCCKLNVVIVPTYHLCCLVKVKDVVANKMKFRRRQS